MLHIFIISLKQDIEKRATISKTLNNFNLNFTFIDAVYGKELSPEYLDSLRNRSSGKLANRGFPATPGEIGCTLSHIKAYQEVIDRGLKWACILEDDAILDSRFKVFIEKFRSDLLESENLYLLGGQTPGSKKNIVKSLKNIKTIGFQKFYKTIGSEDIIYRTCCYLISYELAEKLTLLVDKKLLLADDWAYLVKNNYIKNIYLSNFVEHPIDLSDSNIQKERHQAILDAKKNIITVNLNKRIKSFLISKLRLVALNTYRYIEKKDRSR